VTDFLTRLHLLVRVGPPVPPATEAVRLRTSIDPALPVASIDDTTYEPHPQSAKVIAQAYSSQPPQPV
jgi:hypothetical protein